MQQLSSTSLRVLFVNSCVINCVLGFIFNSQGGTLDLFFQFNKALKELQNLCYGHDSLYLDRPIQARLTHCSQYDKFGSRLFMSHAHSLGCKYKPYDNLDDFMHKFSKTKVTFQPTHFQLYLDTLLHMSMLCSNVRPQLPLLTYPTLTQLKNSQYWVPYVMFTYDIAKSTEVDPTWTWEFGPTQVQVGD